MLSFLSHMFFSGNKKSIKYINHENPFLGTYY
ncbi:hypothetical protein ABIE32_002524 [Comamonas sp. 4034]